MSFAKMKSRKSSIDKLVSAAEAAGGAKKDYSDARVWKITRDKAGNGYAVIRFLPAAEGNELPWSRHWDHGFQGPNGQWYIENSLTSIGQEDPVGQLNGRLWNAGDDKSPERAQARRQKRRLNYYANVLIVNDPANPDNNGQVRLLKFGKKIFDKLMDAMKPEFEDETPFDPFDFWKGANFKLKIRQDGDWPSYDKSEFESPSAVADGDDEKLEEIYNSLHDLSEFVDPKNYKTYDELQARLNAVLGDTSGGVMRKAEEKKMGHEEEPSAGKSTPEETNHSDVAETSSADDDGDEDTMSYFAKLAAEST